MRRQSKIQNPAKSPSRGGGVDLNFRGGGVIKNRNRWGSTPPDTPLAHL